VSTVGRNKKAVEQYVRNQEKEDMLSDQISIKEFDAPFKGWQVTILCGWRIVMCLQTLPVSCP